MKAVRDQIRKINEDEEGLSTVEYIIILVLIAVLGIAVWRTFGEAVEEEVTNAESEIRGLR